MSSQRNKATCRNWEFHQRAAFEKNFMRALRFYMSSSVRVLYMPTEVLRINHGFVQIDLFFKEFLYFIYCFFIKFCAETVITVFFWIHILKQTLSWHLSKHGPHHLNNHCHQIYLILWLVNSIRQIWYGRWFRLIVSD